MKEKLFFITAVLFTLLFTSCLPQISIKSTNSDEVSIFFSTGFTEATAKTLKALTGAPEDSPLFNKDDVLQVLKSSGAEKTSVSIPNPTEIAATGVLAKFSKHPFSITGLIKKTDNSISLTLGPNQILSFYELLSEDAKTYLDLMMIPALIGEKMTAQEYKNLLSSMYGPTFADEITNGKLTVNLSSPDGKKSLKETVSLGEILTLSDEKSWLLKF